MSHPDNSADSDLVQFPKECVSNEDKKEYLGKLLLSVEASRKKLADPNDDTAAEKSVRAEGRRGTMDVKSQLSALQSGGDQHEVSCIVARWKPAVTDEFYVIGSHLFSDPTYGRWLLPDGGGASPRAIKLHKLADKLSQILLLFGLVLFVTAHHYGMDRSALWCGVMVYPRILVTISYFSPSLLKNLLKQFSVIFMMIYVFLWSTVLMFINRNEADAIPINIGLIGIGLCLWNACLVDCMPHELRQKRSKTIAMSWIFMVVYQVGFYFNWQRVEREVFSTLGGEITLTTTSCIASITSTLLIFMAKFGIKSIADVNSLTFIQSDVQVIRIPNAEATLLKAMYEVEKDKFLTKRGKKEVPAGGGTTTKVTVEAATE